MTSYMLDTNICSFIMREKPASAEKRFRQVPASQDLLVISAVTHYELLVGAFGKKASPKHLVLVSDLVVRLNDVLAWDSAAAEHAARLYTDLAGRGTPIGIADAMIAGHALATGCMLVTNNTREFGRVSGLAVEDWSA